MQSPATAYMHEIVGADAVLNGKATNISGITAKGNVLTVKLTTSLPDFLSRLTMPFFCPLPPGTPHDPDGINNPAGSGPYYIASRQVNRQIITKRNTNYKGPRPHNVDQIIETIGPTLEACRAQHRAERHRLLRGRRSAGFLRRHRQEVRHQGSDRQGAVLLQHVARHQLHGAEQQPPAFKGNLNLRKAVNFAIDRPAMVRAGGYLGGKRTDQILPPAMTKDVNIYPIKGADPTDAKKLAAGHMPSGNQLTLYTANAGPA